MKIRFSPSGPISKQLLVLGVVLTVPAMRPVFAQYPPVASPPVANVIDNTQGPVRLARFSIVDGNVAWRPDASSQWQGGEINLPLNQGAQVWSDPNSRGEIQFDDGTLLRLGPNASITLTTLYSDSQGEYTQLQQTSGLVTIEPTNDHSIYEVDTPQAQVKVGGPAGVRIGVGQVTDVAVRAGTAQVESPAGPATVGTGQYLVVPDGATGYQLQGIPYPDSWDQWNLARDQELASAAAQVPQGALPADLNLAAPGLCEYGDWQYAPVYGYVWHPHVYRGWRPYYAGHWVSVAPFGWTWVSAEPWGWAPYHYGSWVDTPGGWGWVPGPGYQYWSPAVVHFTYYGGNVAWCPLAPEEVRYPAAFRVGIYGNSWSAFFSIGGCAIYLSDGSGVCSPRPWDFGYLHAHRWDRVYGGFGPHGFGPGHFVDHAFVPRNQRLGGAVVADAGHFQFAGAYRAGGPETATLFARGRSATFAAGFGPATVRPIAFAVTGTRPGHVPPVALVQRHTFGSGFFGAARFTGGTAVSAFHGTLPATHLGTGARSFAPVPAVAGRLGTSGGTVPTAVHEFGSGGFSAADSAAAARRNLGAASAGAPVRTITGFDANSYGSRSTVGADSHHQTPVASPDFSRPSSGFASGFGTSSSGGRSSGTTVSHPFTFPTSAGARPSSSGTSSSGTSSSSSNSSHHTSGGTGFSSFGGGPNHGH